MLEFRGWVQGHAWRHGVSRPFGFLCSTLQICFIEGCGVVGDALTLGGANDREFKALKSC